MPHPFLDLPRPLVIGHRGCAGELPENTLASFERALLDGAVILESDVHLSRDGVPVLIHDDDVGRMCDGSGAVASLSFDALRGLDAGHDFAAPDGSFPFRGAGHRIPSLAEALAALPGARFNLELKEHLPGLVERTLAVVREADREPLTLLTAADDALMEALRAGVKREGARVALGASTGEVARFAVAAARGDAPPPGPMALQIPTTFGGRPLVTRELVAAAHAHDVQVHVWTVNDTGEMERLLDLGVDGIVSDFPGRVAAVARARAGA